jgi:hypothetical protein
MMEDLQLPQNNSINSLGDSMERSLLMAPSASTLVIHFFKMKNSEEGLYPFFLTTKLLTFPRN